MDGTRKDGRKRKGENGEVEKPLKVTGKRNGLTVARQRKL
jgi:hypothetical protein